MKHSLNLVMSMILMLMVSLSGVMAQGKLKITQSASEPTQDVYKQTVQEGLGSELITAYKRAEVSNPSSYLVQEIGQTFSTYGAKSNLQMKGVTFKVMRCDDLAKGLEVSISIYESSDAESSPIESKQVAKLSGKLPAKVETGDYMTFTFSEPVLLSPNRYYTVIFAFEEMSHNGSRAVAIGFNTIGKDLATEGLGHDVRRWVNNDGRWTRTRKNGLVTYVEAIPKL